MNYARIINGVVIDVSTTPTRSFSAQIAAEFVPVADNVLAGWRMVDEVANGLKTGSQIPKPPATVVESFDEMVDGQPVQRWRYINDDPAPVERGQKPPTVSVIQYKMLFTVMERIAAKASQDPVIVDLHELMNDPRTKDVDLSLASVGEALDYMTALGLIAPGRKAEILTGVVR